MSSAAPGTAAALNDIALDHLKRGAVEPAFAAWEEALALDPEHFETLLNLTLTRWRLGQTTDEDAAGRFVALRAATGEGWPAILGLGFVHLERRDLVLAEELLEDAARRAPRGLDLDLEPLLGAARAHGSASMAAEVRVERPPSFRLPIALAEDGGVLVVGEGDDVVLRRSDDLGVLTRLGCHAGPVDAVAVTPDAKLAVSGSKDASLRVWDLSSGRERRRLAAPDLGPVLSVAVSADGKRAASVSLDPAYVEAKQRQAEGIRRWLEENPESCVRPEDIDELRVVHLWDLDSGERRVIERGPAVAECVRLSRDGRRVVAGEDPGLRLPPRASLGPCFAATRDGRLGLWAAETPGLDGERRSALSFHDLASGRCLRTLAVEHGADAVALSGDGRLAIVARSGQSLLQAWRLPASWDPLVPLRPSSPAPAGPFRYPDKGVLELHAEARQALARYGFEVAFDRLSALRERPGYERTEESCAAWARLYPFCTRRSLRSAWIVREFEIDRQALARLAPDGSSIARAGGKPVMVLLEHPRTGRPLRVLEGTVDRLGSLAFSANTKFLAAGGYASIAVWDLATGRAQVSKVRHFDAIRDLWIADDGREARFVHHGNTKVWDGSESLRSGESSSETLPHDSRTSVGDGRWRFEVGARGGVSLVDENLGTRRVLIPWGVDSAEVSRDGEWLLTVERAVEPWRRVVRVRFLDWDLAVPPDRRAPSAERWIAYEDKDGRHQKPLEEGEWVVGRADECDVVVRDFGISRRHAKLVVDGQGTKVVDLKSKGGTQVNGVAVLECPLVSGDRLRFGTVEFEFFESFSPR